MQLETILDRPDVPVDVKETIKSYLVEQKQLKETQQELGLQIRQTLDSMGDAIHVVDTDLRFLLFNKVFKQWNKDLGLKEDVIGLRVDEVFPFLSDTTIDEYNQVFSNGKLIVREERAIIQEREFITETQKIPVFVEGKVTQIVTVVKNITEYKQAMIELQESEEKYRNLIERANDGIAIVQDSLIKFFNPSLAEMTGYTFEEIESTPFMRYVHPDVLSDVINRYERRMAGKSVPSIYETKLVLKNGKMLEVEVNAGIITFQGKSADLAIIRDVSERKQVEQALRESEEKYRTILENIEDGYYEVDLVGNFTFFNDSTCRIHGYSRDELMGMNNREYTDKQTAETVFKTFNSVYRTGKPTKIFSYEITRKDGTKRVNEAIVSLITDLTGQPTGFRGIIRDITERIKVERALRESKEKYQMLVEKLEEGVTLEDTEGIFTFVNPKTAELLGYSEEELLGKHWSYIVPEEYFDQVTIETRKRPEGIGSTYEASLLAKDGQHIPVIITSTPVSSATGEFDGVLTVFTDITERKLGERKVQESAMKYRTILETIEEGYYEVDLTGNFTFYNDSICKILGYTKDELLGMNFRQYMDEENTKMVFETYNTVFRTGETSKLFNFEVIRKDKKKIFNEASVSLITNSDGEPTGFRGIVRDITERYEMEKALDEERVKYQMLVEKLEEGVTLEDTEGIITFANPKTLETLGYTEEELLGKHWSFIVPEREHEKSSVETAKRAKGISSIYESKVIAKDGTISPVIVTATPIFLNTGEFQGVLVLSTDITERKRVEEELKQSEEKYSNLFHYSNDAIFLHDLDGKIVDVNQKTLDLFGYTKSEILQIKIPSLHPPEMIEASRNAFERIVEDGFVTFEISFIKKNGEVIPADVSSSLFTIGDQKVIQGIVRDITERKKAEQALQQAKLEEERYHAMMSHFINNDMQKIINNLELLSLMYESKLELDSSLVNRVINIASGSSKTIDMVNKIFEVLQSPFIRPIHRVKLIDIINEVVSELPAFSQLVNIDKKNLEASIFVDMHLKDVFTELLLFILRSYTRSTKTSIDIKGFHRHQYFCIVISDYCSEPLSKEIISKLSGKITDKWEIIGHNIGVALASVIMQYYGGSLEIHPSELKGNEFQLLFPLELIKNTREIT